MLASSVALVAVRIWAGPRRRARRRRCSSSLVRGILTLLVSPLFGHTTLHFPLYLAEAVVVELIALRVGRDKPIHARAAGRARHRHDRARRRVGVVVRLVDDPVALEHARRGRRSAASSRRVAGGVTGGFIGRALSSPELAPKPVPRFALPAALVALVAVVAYATPITAGDRSKRDVTLTDAKPAPEREVNVAGQARPARRRRRRLLVRDHRLAGQGGPLAGRPDGGGLPRRLAHHRAAARLRRLEVDAAPAQGLRVQGLAVYFPEDKAIPVKAVPGRAAASRARSSATRSCSSASRSRASRRSCRVGRLPRRAADLPRPLRLDGLGPGAAAAAARYARSSRVTAAGPSASGRAVPPHACHSLSTGNARSSAVVTSPVRKMSSSRNVYWNAAVTRGSSYHLTSRRWSWRQARRSAAGVVRLSSPACGAPTPVSVIHTTCFFGHLWVAAALAASADRVDAGDVAVLGEDRRAADDRRRQLAQELLDRGALGLALVEAGELAEHVLLVAGRVVERALEVARQLGVALDRERLATRRRRSRAGAR